MSSLRDWTADFFRCYIKRSRISHHTRKYFGHLGSNVVIERPFLHNKRLDNVSIGDNTTLLFGGRISIYPSIDNENPKIVIGADCYLGYNISLLAGEDIIIGNNVLMASNILITSENHGIDPESDIEYMDQSLSGQKVKIGDGCWIGQNVCVLPGVAIGEKCIIGAGSVVTKSIPAHCIAAGNPARIIKKYNFETHQWER